MWIPWKPWCVFVFATLVGGGCASNVAPADAGSDAPSDASADLTSHDAGFVCGDAIVPIPADGSTDCGPRPPPSPDNACYEFQSSSSGGGTICYDAPTQPTCVGGRWTCVAGLPACACNCFGPFPVGCICTPHGMVCGDAGTGDG